MTLETIKPKVLRFDLKKNKEVIIDRRLQCDRHTDRYLFNGMVYKSYQSYRNYVTNYNKLVNSINVVNDKIRNRGRELTRQSSMRNFNYNDIDSIGTSDYTYLKVRNDMVKKAVYIRYTVLPNLIETIERISSTEKSKLIEENKKEGRPEIVQSEHPVLDMLISMFTFKDRPTSTTTLYI